MHVAKLDFSIFLHNFNFAFFYWNRINVDLRLLDFENLLQN